ncbi:MAG TPA: hypothetical protein VEU32_18880 [Burkholderiales bacterium]|nr:hypothetical protein [Burkholderiales bacterium]
MSITERTDEEIRAMADPLWRDLVKYSNEGKYGEFAKNFSSSLALAMDQIVAGHQFANSELARNLSEELDPLGIIRRGEHVTVLYRQRSTKKPGEWLGRLVLGYENDKVRIFGASIF